MALHAYPTCDSSLEKGQASSIFASIVKIASQKKPQTPKPTPEKIASGLTRADLLRIVGLMLLAVVCWCTITGRTNGAAWQVPLEYGQKGADGDATGVLAAIKAGSEGEFTPFLIKNISRMGAPYNANWSDNPITEEWQYFLPGVLARWIGVFAAANFAVLLAQVLACICFYLAARLSGCKWEWSFAGGIAFGFAQFALARSVHHLMVVNYWHIPFCLLIAGWITRNEMGEFRGGRYLFAVLASWVIGMQHPYYTNMFLQLTLLGAFYQYFRQGWKPVLQAGGIVAAAAFGFFLMNLDTFVYRFLHGANNGAVVRPYIWLELSALKFMDLLIPPPDHALLGGLGEAYYKIVAFPGEVPPSCYLGLLGIGCLIWLAVVSARRLLVQPGRNLPLEAWQVLWILAYSVVGGLNCLAGVLGITLFRSSTRFCIFILPILLLFALKRLSRKPLDPEVRVVLAGLCVLLALWDQTPPMASDAKIAEDARLVDSDRAFAQQMEARLPKGAMVFQLPLMEYPESPAPGMPSYDHVKGRSWTEWPQHLGSSFPEVVHALESFGFAAVYVNRNGFGQDKGAGLLQSFRNLGYTEVIESKAGDLFCILIHADPHPRLPAGTVE
ncbi:MAG: hypothetical protein NTZ46_02255 [Verrucomicrobia bacterium]|nr:hypothetical protein [Verrucomicrobiota bacterium]